MSKFIVHEELTVDSAVVSLTPAVYGSSATFAKVHAEDGAMRYCYDGQNPTSSFGDLLEDGDIIEIPSLYHIKNFKVVKAGNDPGKITVTYEN